MVPSTPQNHPITHACQHVAVNASATKNPLASAPALGSPRSCQLACSPTIPYFPPPEHDFGLTLSYLPCLVALASRAMLP